MSPCWATRAPAGRPIQGQPVTVRIGAWRRQLYVFGDRVWSKSGVGFTASEPRPFTSIPLAYDRAFGGRARAPQGFEGGYPQNLDGQGMIFDRAEVDGSPLPNIEEADQLIKSWEDRPMPAGVAPLPRHSALRAARGMVVNLEEQQVHLLPAAFSFAHPRMQLRAYQPREKVYIHGMRADGTWSFLLPELALTAAVDLGGQRYDLALEPDTLCVFPDYTRFFVIARCAFVYEFRPERLRAVAVREGSPASTGVTTSIAAELNAAAPLIGIERLSAELPLPFDLVRESYPLTRMIESLPLLPSR